MKVCSFDDARLFAEAARLYMERDPFSTSVIAVHVDGVRCGIRVPGQEDRFWTLLDAGQIVGVAMHTPPHNLFVSRMPSAAAIELDSCSPTPVANHPG